MAEVVLLLLVVCSGGVHGRCSRVVRMVVVVSMVIASGGGGVHGNQHELVRLGGQCGTECQRQIE